MQSKIIDSFQKARLTLTFSFSRYHIKDVLHKTIKTKEEASYNSLPTGVIF